MRVSVQVHRNIHTLIQETFNRYKTSTQSSNSVPSRIWHVRSTYLRYWCQCHLHRSCDRRTSSTCISLFGNQIQWHFVW